MEKFFNFISNEETIVHICDTLIAVMIAKKNNRVDTSEIIKHMSYQHNDIYLDWLLKFIENLYNDGYTITKYDYIKENRKDIMNAIAFIEAKWVKYKLNTCFEEIQLNS